MYLNVSFKGYRNISRGSDNLRKKSSRFDRFDKSTKKKKKKKEKENF